MLKSLKNKLKKAKKETAAMPREISVIKAAYEDLRAKAGEAQYNAHVYTKSLADINAQLESLNYEAAARQKMDRESAVQASVSPATETNNEQSGAV